MIRTDRFARNLCAELRGLIPSVNEWQECWCPVPGNEHVDVVGLRKGKGPILVEVELRRKNPVSNVVKIWRWLEAGKFKRKPIVVQAFTSYYKGHGTHRSNAVFVGEKMSRAHRVQYHAIDFPFKPRKGGKTGGGAQRRQAQSLALTISRILKAKTS